MSPDPEPETLEVQLVLEAIHARYGYDLRAYEPKSIQRRLELARVKSGLAHLGDLQHRLIRDPTFFATVLQSLTVRTTELFREPACFRTFRSKVVPLLRTYPLIKLWHAGCAGGEEIYSMAILLTEEGLYERAQIYATDLSAEALAEAKEGVYSARDLARAREGYLRAGGKLSLDHYCTEAFGRLAMREALRRNVHFFQHDLVSDQVFGEMHVVFCRNVLIYFGPELKHRVFEKLTRSLCPGGFLALGESERLDTRDRYPEFKMLDTSARIYRHGG